MASLSAYGVTHPPRSNPSLRSSSGPPSPCITPSTVIIVMVVSFMVATPPISLVCSSFDSTGPRRRSHRSRQSPSVRSIPHLPEHGLVSSRLVWWASTRRGHPASVPRSDCHRSPRRAGARGARRSASPERSPGRPTAGTPTATAPWLAGAAHSRCRGAGDLDGRRDAPPCLRVERGSTDLTVRLSDEHVLVAKDDVGDDVERLLVRVDVREERQCCLGGEE